MLSMNNLLLTGQYLLLTGLIDNKNSLGAQAQTQSQSGSGLNTSGGTAGGGDVLKYIGDPKKNPLRLMDNSELAKYYNLPYVKFAIVVLIGIAVALIILKIFEIKSPFKGKTIVSELNYLDKVAKHDKNILQANQFIDTATKIIEHSPLAFSRLNYDYWEYNLKRANIRIPGGYRVYKPEEFNALVRFAEIGIVIISILLIVLFSAPIGTLGLIVGLVFAEILPLATIRKTVVAKDEEIVDNFADMYLMVHYVLLASAGTPIANILKSYDKTTESEEMHRFIDICTTNIDTYGEYSATRYITADYREIPQVGKLMRLIRQANEGGDVRSELMGFRQELLNERKYKMEQRMNKLIFHAKASFNILTPVLIQAVISAMAIYAKDIGVAGSFM